MNNFMCQCVLVNENLKTVAWIPEIYATKNKKIIIDDKNWTVKSIGSKRPYNNERIDV